MTEQKYLTVKKWYWVWQFEEEEQWLAEMAADGWVLNRVDYATYHFERCEPGEYTVRLEMLENWPDSAAGQDYIRQKQTEGAEYLGSVMRWVYFRKKGEWELLPDPAARLRHIDRMLPLLGAMTAVFGLNFGNLFNAVNSFGGSTTVAAVLVIVEVLLVGLFFGGILQLQELKKRYSYEQQYGEAPARRTVRKWYWVWEFEEEEQWMNRMAADGWVLDGVAFCKYTFRRCTPGEYTVRLQFAEKLANRSYVDFVEETGGEYIGRMAKWIYFRQKTADGPFELFSDLESRYNQLEKIYVMLVLVCTAAMLVGTTNLYLAIAGSLPNLSVALVDYAGAALIAYCALRIKRKMRAVKAQRALYE